MSDDLYEVITAFPWGGPAFPVETSSRSYGGMSLRDWFAGHAMVGILNSVSEDAKPPLETHVARTAYSMADAMLAERQKETK